MGCATGMGRRVNTIMQTAFFAISGVLPREQAIEEINVLEEDAHYGWPYCYDASVPNPEFNDAGKCANSVPPAMNFPPHWAPLASLDAGLRPIGTVGSPARPARSR